MRKKLNKIKINWKILFILLCLFSSIGIIVGCFSDWTNINWIFIAGSSSMQPLMVEISNNYKNAEISVNSGGSSYGIQSVLNNKKNIGAVSKMPSIKTAGLPGVEGKYSKQWENEKIKTITLTRDSIALIYKAPIDDELIVTNDNIEEIYKVFCGYELISWDKILTTTKHNKKIIPFSRAGGAKESGTAEAFLTNNNIGYNGSYEYLSKQVGNNKNDSIWSIIETGNYGKFVKQTNESNLESWEAIKHYSDQDIPITYLNGSFVMNNLEEITKEGFRVAKYKTSNGNLIIPGTNELNVNYNWSRPLNLIIKTNNYINNDIKNFIQWIMGNLLFDNSIVKNIYKQLSFVNMTPESIKSMFANNTKIVDDILNYSKSNPDKTYLDYYKDNINNDWSGFWYSDYELYKLQKDERDKTKEYYGALLIKS